MNDRAQKLSTPALPPPLDTQVFWSAPTTWGHAGVVQDPQIGAYAATLAVGGRQFALIERGEQEGLLSLWGDALAAFCREASPVAEVRWIEWVAPAGMEEQHAYLRDHAVADPTSPALRCYRELLGTVAPVATRHEILLTVVISARRVRTGPRGGGAEASSAAAIEVLLDEVRQFRRRLEAAGLSVSGPLGPRELWRAVRVRLDPTVMSALERGGRSLGERAGRISAADRGPRWARRDWNHFAVDDSLHRAWRFREWPRFDVGPTWMSELLLYSGCVRSVAVSCQPVPLRVSQRTILRQAAKLEADVDQRRRTGFRVGAHHRRAAQAVEEREEELVSGFSELEYAGIVDVTASTHAELEAASADVRQVAASCGVELASLPWKHPDGLAACLPVARGLAHRVVAA